MQGDKKGQKRGYIQGRRNAGCCGTYADAVR